MNKHLRQILRSVHLVFLEWQTLIRVQIARWDHRRALERVRRKARSGVPLRVLFIDSEIAKWKAQSLYDRMKADPRYEPVIGVSVRDEQTFQCRDPMVVERGMKDAEAYFTALGCRCVRIYDSQKRTFIDLKEFEPDIVFYEQAWYDYGVHHARIVSKFAITCYIPYYVPNFGDLRADTRINEQRFFSYYFTLNEDWSNAYRQANGWWYTSCEYVAAGHPMLDQLYVQGGVAASSNVVIYAPHWSVRHPKSPVTLSHATFLVTGREILAYAKKHREFNWVFKPHPKLIWLLKTYGIWSEREVDDYVGEWRKIGVVCQDGDYMGLFRESMAMITDSASFLTEYGATGKPIIRLVSPVEELHPIWMMEKLYATYYEVRTIPDMLSTFAEVLEKGNDYKKIERQREVENARLSNSCAAKNIMDFLDRCLWKGMD